MPQLRAPSVPSSAQPAMAQAQQAHAQMPSWLQTMMGLAGLDPNAGVNPADTLMPMAGVGGPLTPAAEAVLRQVRRIPNPLKVFHGTGANFDRFSMDAIGRGEGAQAFGHGLYFTDSRGIAKTYADKLTKATYPTIPELAQYFAPGKVVPGYGGLDRVLEFRADDVLDGWRVKVQRVGPDGLPQGQPRWHSTNPSVHELGTRQGMYEVDLHTRPDQLIDWNKPLQYQPSDVRQGLQHLGVPDVSVRLPTVKIEGHETSLPATGAGAYKYLSAQRAADDTYLLNYAGIPGSQEASRDLNAIGIPGMQYDAGTRSLRPTLGTAKNYVIWNDGIIDIAKKYGIVPPAVGAMWAKRAQVPDQDISPASHPSSDLMTRLAALVGSPQVTRRAR